jgi:hypothetical protein
MKNNSKLKKDFLITIGLIAIGFAYAYFTRDMFIGRSLIAGIVVMGLPITYLLTRPGKNIKKIILAGSVFGLLFGFALSLYAEATGAWTTNSYIFNFRIFGLNTLEEIFGHFLMATLTFSFYEHFFDQTEKEEINKKYPIAIIGGTLLSIFFISWILLRGTNEFVDYAYIYAGVAAIIPTGYVLWRHPRLIGKVTSLGYFFFFFWLLSQQFAVNLDYWGYEGIYVGTVELLGAIYPFEELFFWMLLYSPSIVAYYEVTMDDSK